MPTETCIWGYSVFINGKQTEGPVLAPQRFHWHVPPCSHCRIGWKSTLQDSFGWKTVLWVAEVLEKSHREAEMSLWGVWETVHLRSCFKTQHICRRFRKLEGLKPFSTEAEKEGRGENKRKKIPSGHMRAWKCHQRKLIFYIHWLTPGSAARWNFWFFFHIFQFYTRKRKFCALLKPGF